MPGDPSSDDDGTLSPAEVSSKSESSESGGFHRKTSAKAEKKRRLEKAWTLSPKEAATHSGAVVSALRKRRDDIAALFTIGHPREDALDGVGVGVRPITLTYSAS